MKYILAFAIFATFSVQAESPKIFQTKCGGTMFKVTAAKPNDPMENTYTLSIVSATGDREIAHSEEGDGFHAACLPTKDGKQLLVYQNYCGGSACLEGKFGVVDPTSLKVILRPSKKNVENTKQLSSILGAPAPHIGQIKGAFCCEK